jgi:hypothetical protein
MSTIYKQERNHQNWTGRVPRQSRITGQWARDLKKQRRIPVSGYVCAVLAVLAFWLANFL